MDNISIISNILEYSSFDDIIMDLETKGFNVPHEIDTEDEIESYSTTVNWYANFNVSKDNKIYKIYLTGSAIAEISYERWTETYGYEITDYNVNLVAN